MLDPGTPEEVVAAWGKHLQRPGGARGLSKAAQLLQCASRSVGRTVALDVAKLELRHLLDAYERVQAVLAEYETWAEQLLSELPGAQELQSVGLSPTLTAAILAFGGDLRQFEHGNQLLRKAGLKDPTGGQVLHRGPNDAIWCRLVSCALKRVRTASRVHAGAFHHHPGQWNPANERV